MVENDFLKTVPTASPSLSLRLHRLQCQPKKGGELVRDVEPERMFSTDETANTQALHPGFSLQRQERYLTFDDCLPERFAYRSGLIALAHGEIIVS